MPRKPDRFERVVKERMETDGGLWSDSAADLLRKEHAWMRRMVKDVRKWATGDIVRKDDVTIVILERLTQRRK